MVVVDDIHVRDHCNDFMISAPNWAIKYSVSDGEVIPTFCHKPEECYSVLGAGKKNPSPW